MKLAWFSQFRKGCSSKDAKVELIHNAKAHTDIFAHTWCPMHLIGREISIITWAALSIQIRVLMLNCIA